MASSKIANKKLVVVPYETAYTVDANGTANADFQPSRSGYKPIGAVGFSTNHGSVLLQQVRLFDTGTLRMTVRNVSNGSISNTAEVRVLFEPE